MKRWYLGAVAALVLLAGGAIALVVLELVQLERDLTRCEELGIPAPECR